MIFGQQPVVQIQVCTVSRELKANMFEEKTDMLLLLTFLHVQKQSSNSSKLIQQHKNCHVLLNNCLV